MTTYDVLQILWRRWKLVVACLLVTMVTAAVVSAPITVYWSKTDVLFVYPGPRNSNSLVTTSDSVIATAGLIAVQVNSTAHNPRLSTDDVSIVDAGIFTGSLIRLPNSGGQWAVNFNKPMLNVQVSGSDPEEVRSRAAAEVAQILGILKQRQAAAHVTPAELITARPSPALPVVEASRGSRIRALAGLLVLGLGLTFAVVLFFDQVSLRRRRTGVIRH